MMTFQELVDQEITKARRKHSGINSRHEGVAVILEEFEEFKEAVFRDRPHGEVLKELVQVAAMCQRCAEDVPRLLEAGNDGHYLDEKFGDEPSEFKNPLPLT